MYLISLYYIQKWNSIIVINLFFKVIISLLLDLLAKINYEMSFHHQKYCETQSIFP